MSNPTMTKSSHPFSTITALRILLWALVLVGFTPFVVHSFYNQPFVIDDYFCSQMVRQNGYLFFLKYFWTQHSSRYIANLLHGANPLVWAAFWPYQLLPLVFFGWVYYGLFAWLFALMDQLGKYKADCALAAGLFLVLFLAFIPSISEFFYWYSGGVVYALGTGMFFCYLACLTSFLRQAKRSSLVGVSGWLLALQGTNEYLALFAFAILGFATLTTHWHGLPQARSLVKLLGASLLVFICLFWLLGSHKRAANFANEIDLGTLTDFLRFAHAALGDLLYRFKNTSLLIVSFLYVFLGLRLAQLHPTFTHLATRFAWLGSLVGFCVVFWAIWLIVLAFGFTAATTTVARRIVSLGYLLLLVGYWWHLQLFLGWVVQKKLIIRHFLLPKWLVVFLIMLVVYKLSFPENKIAVAYRDWLTGKTKIYHEAQMERYRKLAQASPADTLVLPLLPPNEILQFGDLSPRPEHNAAYAAFWGWGGVKVQEAKK
jgi:hypothetical protein